jgi:hypothetical protein
MNINKKDTKKLNLLARLILLCLLINILLPSILAVPPLPTEIYGTVKSYNRVVPTGTIVSVYDSRGHACGTFAVANSNWSNSYFGVLTCRGEDENTPGPVEGELLHFRIGAAYASAVTFNGYVEGVPPTDARSFNYSRTNVTWQNGTFKYVVLVAPPLVCGDSYCDTYENCNTCERDCGKCPISVVSNTTNTTSGGTGTGAGTGIGGGDTGEDDDDNTDGTPKYGMEGDEEEYICVESWLCAEWQDCLPSGKQMRDCEDLNACGTSEDMPEIVKSCIYEQPQAPDGVNQTENIPPVIPPRKEAPLIITTCKERLKLLSLPSLVFFTIIILILFIAEADYRKKLKGINQDKKIDELKKLELRYIEYRKKVIFYVLIIVLSVIIYVYHYFFFLCKDKYIQYLWLLSWGIILVPIVVHIVLALSKYSDSQKTKRLSTLNDVHYKHIEALREIANRELIIAEDNISTRIYELEKKEEFNALLTEDKIIGKIYSDMTKLFNLYKTLQNPMNVEKDLLENIRKLDEDTQFLDAAKLHPELEVIRSSLSSLYSAYEYKQALYDELLKVELEHGVRSPILR